MEKSQGDNFQSTEDARQKKLRLDRALTAEIPVHQPEKNTPEFDEIRNNMKLAVEYLLSSGMSLEDVKGMKPMEMYKLARRKYQEAKSAASGDQNKEEELRQTENDTEEESDNEGLWYEGIDKDLVRVVSPVHRYREDRKTERPQEEIKEEYISVDQARVALGQVYRNIREEIQSEIKDMEEEVTDEKERSNLRSKIKREYREDMEDACFLVFNNPEGIVGVKSGMTRETAEKWLQGLGVDISKGGVEKKESTSEVNVEQVMKNIEKISDEETKNKVRRMVEVALHLWKDETLRGENQNLWEKSKPVLAILGIKVI